MTHTKQFVWDFTSDHDAHVVNDMLKNKTHNLESISEFQEYIKSSIDGLWQDVCLKFKQDCGQAIPTAYLNFLADRMSVIGNKEAGSRKRHASFDFEKYFNKFHHHTERRN